jgi:hypothetical protein
MPYSVVDKGSKYFNTITYTGTGASLANTGVGFQPDWVWIKGRSGATDHAFYDAVRGVQKQIESNTQTAETTETTGLTAFGSDGFTIGALAQLNTSAATYVAWNWLGANTTVSNTSGSITSTVSASTTSGFSIVSFTGTGANATVGHGLGVAPKMIIIKNRTIVSDSFVYNSNLTSNLFYLRLTTTDAQTNTSGSAIWNSTSPTSTVFSLGTSSSINGSTNAMIAYCFADVKGFSKFGSYVGNGSADGTFVYTGFRPKFIMIKGANTATSWIILDTSRNIYNPEDLRLVANLSNAEASGFNILDGLSNGFKLRDNNVTWNDSAGTYIYMAFAENPFVSSKGLPCTAR